MNINEYPTWDAITIAQLIKEKKISPKEILKEAISRAENINPYINAIICPLYEYAQKNLKNLDLKAPLAGVPFLLKDLLSHLEGTPLTSGSKIFKNFISPFDSEVVKRYKRAGLVIMGKTNTPEMGLMGTTEPDLFGPTKNPWNYKHIAGGSSGGSAAAVASRIVPVAGGGDGGGSLRIPASCCGVFGFKPSRGRVPSGPEFGEIWEGAVVEHVISVSVRDSALILDLITGPDKGAMYWLSPEKESFLSYAYKDPPSLKIGMCVRSPLGGKVSEECKKAVSETSQLLEDMGHRVEEVSIPYRGDLMANCYLTLYFGQVRALLLHAQNQLNKKINKYLLEIETWMFNVLGEKISAGEYAFFLIRWNELCRQMAKFHEKFDLLLTPTIATEPPPLGTLRTSGLEKLLLDIVRRLNLKFLLRPNQVKNISIRRLEIMPFTQIANITGQPAMSLPLYWTNKRLPCGVQFIGPIGKDGLLFSLASQIEKARPWKDRIPPIYNP